MTFDPAYSAQAIARRVPLPHAQVVLADARETLAYVLADQPRDRAWRDGPLDSPDVVKAHDCVEIWSAVIALHERAARTTGVTP